MMNALIHRWLLAAGMLLAMTCLPWGACGALYAETYTLTFDAGTGTCATSSATWTSGDAALTLPTATPPEQCADTRRVKPWRFVGWAKASCAETTARPTLYNGSYTPECSETFYAVYGMFEVDANSSNYTLNFDERYFGVSQWTCTNMDPSRVAGTVALPAHDGTYYGQTNGKSSWAVIVTSAYIPYPKYIRFWVSKTTTNTTACTWTVKTTASNGTETTWATQSGASMGKGKWVEVYADLSGCHDVKVSINYDGATYVKMIDDIELAFYSVTFNSNPDCSDEYAATITEWGQHSVVLSVDEAVITSVATATAYIGNNEPCSPQIVTPVNATAAGVKNIRVPLGDINLSSLTSEGKVLNILWQDANGDQIGSSSVIVPRIIAGDRDMYKTGEIGKMVWETEVHVLPGVTLTANAKRYLQSEVQINELHVYPGATLDVTSGKLTAKTLRLHSGWTRAGDKEYDVARVYIADSATLLKTTATSDYDLYDADEGNCYHPLSVPFTVAVEDVNYADEYLAEFAEYGTHYVIKTYDGESRAENGVVDANWTEVESPGVLQPGTGYMLAAVPVKGEAVIRFPLAYDNAWTTQGEKATVDDQTKNVVDLVAHTGTAAEADNIHAGWNMIANPYLSSYSAEEENFYVSIPTHNFSQYIQENIADVSLLPGWSFFVQTAETGTLTFASGNLSADYDMPISAPQQGIQPVLRAGIILSDNHSSDKTTFLISDQYTDAYEIGADLEKLLGDSYALAVYSLSNGNRLAFNAMDSTALTSNIPIGVRLPADDTYTFSVNSRYASPLIGRMELIDNEQGIVADLLQEDYTFTASRMLNDQRFALRITLASQMSTRLPDDAQTALPGTRKLISNGHLYIIHSNRLYDATGQRL